VSNVPPIGPGSTSLGPGEAVLAFDVGGTDTKSAVIDRQGQVLGLRRTPTPQHPENPASAVVTLLGTLAREHRDEVPGQRPVAAAVSVPGLVDERTGVGIFASNLPGRDAPLQALAERELGLPVALRHDVRAASDAEYRLGAATAYQDVVVLIIGTGIAGGLILGGRPYTGGGYAGEIGHTLSDPAGEPCPCGAVGCLETISSAGAIARRYRAVTGIAVPGALEVLTAAASGDADAGRIWEDALRALAEQLARLAAVLAPEAIVLGGGLAQAGPALFEPLAERLEALLSFHRRPALLRARLGDDAGLLGSALAARDLAGTLAGRSAP
jgi:glucokinase